ncbi:hypothetical protein Q3G72_009667 [Acer saccharum]|nr:hypothetical protein Q3G72_009667 [Acer saccharum]
MMIECYCTLFLALCILLWLVVVLRMITEEVGGGDKEVVREYFNNSGFQRWKKIYGETDDVNKVQRDIRLGHSKMVENVMAMLTDEGPLKGLTVSDARCGTGSLAISLAKEGAIVLASDISAAMVAEAKKQAEEELSADSEGASPVMPKFEVKDLESLNTFMTLGRAVSASIFSYKISLGKMAMIDEPLYPIAILIDELKNEDIQLRLNSIPRLSTIARALGVERTRKELIPFLSENNDDDDEVLLTMAEELGVFIPYVGGLEYANVLLPQRETLCTVEETHVREKSVESLCRIGAQMREHDVVEYFIPLVKRLAAREWFMARVFSCGLFHIAYLSAPEALKTELRTIYRQLCQDDMPMVRRSAATNLGKFAATVEAAHLKAEMMSIFEELTNDDQDSVRLLAVEGCGALGKLLEPQDCVAHILPIIVNFSQVKISYCWHAFFVSALPGGY